MVVKAEDQFTRGADADLQNHTPTPTGAAWTVTDSLAFDVIAATDIVRFSVGGGANNKVASEETDIGDDQMDTELKHITVPSPSIGIWIEVGVGGRIPATVAVTGYFNVSRRTGSSVSPASRLELIKVNAGTETVLGTYTATPANDDIIELDIRDTTHSAKLNGTERITSTNQDITGNNFAGMYQNRNSTNTWDSDNFKSESISSGVTVTVPLKTFTLSGQTPAVASGKSVAVPLKSFSLTSFAPTMQHQIVVPLKTFILAGQVPAVASGKSVAVPLKTFTLAGQVLAVASGKNVAVPLQTFTLTALTPAVASGKSVAVPLRTFTLTGFAPTITATPPAAVKNYYSGGIAAAQRITRGIGWVG